MMHLGGLMLMATLSMACSTQNNPMVVTAHRGASGIAPESSVFAYEEALKLPVDYLEGDVQRTQDGHLVIFHDASLGADTDVELFFPHRRNQPIETFTWAELSQLSSGKWFNMTHKDKAQKRFDQAKILRLEDLLKKLDPNKGPGLYLETKRAHAHPNIEIELVALLKQYGWLPMAKTSDPPRVLVQSFEPESLERFRVIAPEMPRVLLVVPMTVASLGRAGLISHAQAVDAYGVGVHSLSCTPWNVSAWHEAGLKIHVYTLNSSWQFFVMEKLGVDGIFTDHPQRLLEFLERESL